MSAIEVSLLAHSVRDPSSMMRMVIVPTLKVSPEVAGTKLIGTVGVSIFAFPRFATVVKQWCLLPAMMVNVARGRPAKTIYIVSPLAVTVTVASMDG